VAEETNPWLAAPLEEYEAHMRSPRVRQLAKLADLFGRALAIRRPESVALLGIAGGNGLDRIDPAVTRRIIGFDINPDYLRETAARYQTLAGLELRCADLAHATPHAEPVQLVHAALVFEHAGLEGCLENALALVDPGGALSVVLQLPSESEPDVGDTGYDSIRALAAGFQLIDPPHFQALVEARGLQLRFQQTEPVGSGKSFWFAIFGRTITAAVPGCTSSVPDGAHRKP
jgi:hypothetical protein